MEEELVALLAGLGHRAAWGEIPQGARFPFVVLARISGFDDMTLDGRSGFLKGRVQVDCLGKSFEQAIAVSRSITAGLSGYRGGSIWSAGLQGIRDGSNDRNGSVIHRISLDFAVTYRE